jgi:hypothetical protein
MAGSKKNRRNAVLKTSGLLRVDISDIKNRVNNLSFKE